MARLPVAGFGCNPFEPSRGEIVRFFDYSYDPGHQGIVSRQWRFGDGSVSAARQPTHQFRVDGDYKVELTVRTPDGRDATVAATVGVRTHEVVIESLRAPVRCQAGETVEVQADLSSGRYDEIVDLRLLVRVPGGEAAAEPADRAIVAVRGGDGQAATSVVLRPTIPASAAVAGSVTVEAVVVILGSHDPTHRDRACETAILVV